LPFSLFLISLRDDIIHFHFQIILSSASCSPDYNKLMRREIRIRKHQLRDQDHNNKMQRDVVQKVLNYQKTMKDEIRRMKDSSLFTFHQFSFSLVSGFLLLSFYTGLGEKKNKDVYLGKTYSRSGQSSYLRMIFTYYSFLILSLLVDK